MRRGWRVKRGGGWSAIAALLLVASMSGADASAQHVEAAASGADLRELHERVVYATVRVQARGGSGSGWLLAQSGRPLVITNAHVARAAARARVIFYRGSEESEVEVRAVAIHASRTTDLGILQLLDDPPSTARPVRLRTDTTVYRGQRVVLGGNPSGGLGRVLPFQTTEGVVTGHVSGRAYRQCGSGRNCVVVDAASFQGSSGGPAFNTRGQLVGMLWGGPAQLAPTATSRGRGVALVQNPAFSYLIHSRTIASELRRLERDD